MTVTVGARLDVTGLNARQPWGKRYNVCTHVSPSTSPNYGANKKNPSTYDKPQRKSTSGSSPGTAHVQGFESYASGDTAAYVAS